MAATTPTTVKDHPDPPPLAEIENWCAEAGAHATKAGPVKAPLVKFRATITGNGGLTPLHRLSIRRYGDLLRQTEKGRGVLVEERTKDRMRGTTASPATLTERETIKANEAEKAKQACRSHVAADLKKIAAECCQRASDAGEAAGEAIEQETRALDLPPPMRNKSNVALQTLTLMQVSDMRTHSQGALPSQLSKQWAALSTPEQRELFSYSVGNAVREMIAGGTIAMKLRFPNLPTDKASREFHCALELAAKFDEAKADREPEWLKAARASFDLLVRAFKSACGLDVRWLSSAEFSKLYLTGHDPADPPTAPFKLAKPELVVTRFLPRSPAAWSGLPSSWRQAP